MDEESNENESQMMLCSPAKQQKMDVKEGEIETGTLRKNAFKILRQKIVGKPSIDDLSDYDLLAIFAAIDLEQLLEVLPNVCRRWKRLTGAARLARRLLVLHIGLDPYCIARRPFEPPYLEGVLPEGESKQETIGENKLNSLRIVEFEYAVSANLATLLPNIVNLEVVLDRVSVDMALEPLLRLLNAYKAHLRSLRLSVRFNEATDVFAGDRPATGHYDFNVIDVSSALLQIFSAINSLKSLHSLWFSAWHYFSPFYRLMQNGHQENDLNGPTSPYHLYMPILSQLERFHFYTHDWGICILPTLQSFASFEKMKEVEVYSPVYSEEAVQQYLDDLPLALQERFTGLSLTAISPDQLSALVCRFTRLTTLELGLSKGTLSLPHLTACLSGLPVLRRLELVVNVEEYLQAQQLLPSDKEALAAHREALTPLPGVLALQLNLKVKWHEHAPLLALSTAFPRLSVLKVVCRQLPCITCAHRGFMAHANRSSPFSGLDLGKGGFKVETAPALLLKRMLQIKMACAKAAIGEEFFAMVGNKFYLKID